MVVTLRVTEFGMVTVPAWLKSLRWIEMVTRPGKLRCEERSYSIWVMKPSSTVTVA